MGWFTRKPRKVVVPRPNGTSKRWSQVSSGAAPRAVRVVDIRRETPSVITVVLEPEDGRKLVFRAGQYLTHRFELNGNVLKRAYSLSSPESGALACTIKLLPGSPAADFFNHHLKVGDHYSVLGPTGDFVLDATSQRPLAFLAGGSGITPIMGLIETALAQQPDRSIRLIYASRNQAEIIFRDRLMALAERHPRFSITHVLSQPEAGWAGERGRLGGARAAELLLTAEADYYLCGPAALMQATEVCLRAHGIRGERIKHELFLAAAKEKTKPTVAQEIVFKRSNRTVTQQPGETVLDAGLREHLPLDFSCTVGGCGHCKVQVLEGHVALNEPNCLTSEEKAAGWTLACSAYAASKIVVNA